MSHPRHCRTATATAPFVAALMVAALVLSGSPSTMQPAQAQDDGTTQWEGLVLPPGVESEVVASNLSYPTAIDWDDQGRLYVSLVGFTPETQQVLQLAEGGQLENSFDLSGADITPQILDITFNQGSLYFSTTGRIHTLDIQTGEVETIVRGLPGWGDHRTDEIVFGPDGRLYVGQGTVTNSGVVGSDQLGQPNAINNVSQERPNYRDIPCVDVTLSGNNWETENPFATDTDRNAEEGAGNDARVVTFTSEEEVQEHIDTALENGTGGAQVDPASEDPAERVDPARQDLWLTWPETDQQRVVTGPFSPFATPTYQGQVVEGDPRCSGAVLSMEPDGSDVRAVAWGFRNPFGLKFADDGRLWVSDNGPDKRGSRPLGPGPDTIQIVDLAEGGVGESSIPWYGWPDYTMGRSYEDPFFSSPYGPDVVPVFEETPGEPLEQFTYSGAHASSNKFDFAPNGTSYENSLFIAEFGSLGLHPVIGALAGMNVARVDMDTGRITEFIVSQNRWSGDFRPVEAAFGPDGRLFVLDFGPANQEEAEGNATHGPRYEEVLVPQRGRVLAFSLPDDLDWEGAPVGNPGDQGHERSGGEIGIPPDGAPVVEVFDYGFSGSSQTRTGETVAFRNEGQVGHTATEETTLFNSGFDLAPGETFLWTPEEEGTYHYYCSVHPVMRGTITVQGELDEEEPDGEGEEEEEPTPGPGLVPLLLLSAGALWWVHRRR